MSRALFLRSLRDSWLLACGVIVGLVLFEGFFVWAMGEFAPDLQEIWMGREFLRNMIKMALGADLAGDTSATAVMSIGLVHPILYTLSWALLITLCVRVAVLEIDRGTADLLLTLPLSRRRIYLSLSLGWMLWGVPVCCAPVLGMWIGEQIHPMWEPLAFDRLTLVAVNLFALYLALGAIVLFVSTWMNRLTEVLTITFIVILVSLLINFLAQFWQPAKYAAPLSLLNYYKPLPTIRDAQLPWVDIAVLIGLTIAGWLGGLWRFQRRDIPAA